jgi:cysteinyl-tRNA synthetase
VVLIDTSVEPTGDLVTALERDLADNAVGLVGRWGVSTSDGFDFDEAQGPEVDGVEGYLMVTRRVLLPEVGLLDPKFKWYRNADLDWSYQIRSKGYRTIIDPALPAVRHEHRLWHNTPEAQRDEISRKNFWRFRDHWFKT